MDERELNYYKQLSNDLGAKVVRLQQEAARAKRETTRARTTAKLTSQLFRISSSDASGEIFELRFLRFILDTMKVDRAALLLHSLDEDTWECTWEGFGIETFSRILGNEKQIKRISAMVLLNAANWVNTRIPT